MAKRARPSESQQFNNLAEGTQLGPRRQDPRAPGPLANFDEPTPPAPKEPPGPAPSPQTSIWREGYHRRTDTPPGHYLCSICKTSISQPAGSTANLIAHYRNKHSAIVERLQDLEEKQSAAQVVRDFVVEEKKKEEVGRAARDAMWRRVARKPDQTARDAYLLLWLTRRGNAYNSVSCPLFQLYVQVCLSSFCTHLTCTQSTGGNDTVSSRKVLSVSTLRLVYWTVMQERLRSLHDTESAAVSFDGWDNSRPNRSLIGLIYHWVDKKWVYHQATLDVVTALAAHTGMMHRVCVCVSVYVQVCTVCTLSPLLLQVSKSSS